MVMPSLYPPQGRYIDRSSPGRTADFIIAAQNASPNMKSQADYVCDGINDAAIIQYYLDALPEDGRGIVQLSGGLFNLSTRLEPTKSGSLRGAQTGWNARNIGTSLRLLNGADTDIIRFDSANLIPFFQIKDMELIGNAAGQAAASHAINAVRNVSDFIVERVFINDMRDQGIRLNAGTTRIWNINLKALWIEDCGGVGIYGYSLGATIGAGADDVLWNVVMMDMYMFNNYEGIVFEGLGSNYHIIGPGVVVQNSRRNGIRLQSVRNAKLTGVTCDVNGTDAVNTYDGIVIEDDGVNPSSEIQIENCRSGNIRNTLQAGYGANQRYGINITDGGAPSDYITILGNNLRNNVSGAANVAATCNLNGEVGHNIGW